MAWLRPSPLRKTSSTGYSKFLVCGSFTMIASQGKGRERLPFSTHSFFVMSLLAQNYSFAQSLFPGKLSQTIANYGKYFSFLLFNLLILYKTNSLKLILSGPCMDVCTYWFIFVTDSSQLDAHRSIVLL